MSAATSLSHRGITPGRLAFLFVILVTLFYFRDVWLPHAQRYRFQYDPSAYSEPVDGTPSSTEGYNDESSGFSPGENEAAHDAPLPTSFPTLLGGGEPLPSPTQAYPADGDSAPYDSLPTHGTVPEHDTPFPSHSSQTQHTESVSKVANSSCQHAPGADKVMVLLKTGATELYQKLPTHFLTTFQCTPHFMVFSDLAQIFADTPIYDAIAPVSKARKDEHSDFEVYRKIIEWHGDGQDVGKLKGESGWNLDKWKFLPMFHQAFESASEDIEWFVMIEADTSLSWPNLLAWLKRLDPNKPLYLGAQNWLGDITFGHGGSGIVVSRAAANALKAARQRLGPAKYDQRWEEETSGSCCGDGVLASAFLDVDIPLTGVWPLIQGETMSSLDWTEGHWCAPPVTFHHVTPVEVDLLYQFQMRWVEQHGWGKPYLYRDLFEHFIDRHTKVNRTSWNNISKDVKFAAPNIANEDDADWKSMERYEQKAVESESACAEACMLWEEGACIQWMYRDGRCHLGRDIRFGQSDEREDEHWTSGWIRERIEKFQDDMLGCEIRWEG